MKETVTYYRKSKDKINQVQSLEAQKNFLKKYNSNTKELKFISTSSNDEIVEISNKNSEILDKMILDIKNKKFDIILLSSVNSLLSMLNNYKRK